MEQPRYLAADGLVLDRKSDQLIVDGRRVALGGRATALLRMLMEQPEEIVSKRAIFEHVWSGLAVSDAVLTTAVKELRKAIGDDARNPRMVETLHARGYRFLLPVEAIDVCPQPVPALGATVPPAAPPERNLRWPMAAILALLAITAVVALTILRPAAPAERSAAAEVPNARSIAVLRFADLSPDQSQGWFADGLTAELLNSLTQSPDMQVANWSTDRSGNKQDPRALGRKLGVANLLQGSVRRDGDHVRVTAELLRTADGYRYWSQNFDRDIKDVISIQEELALAIARSLHTVMDPAQLKSMVTLGTRSVDAYQAYLQGLAAEKAQSESGDEGAARRAAEAFERARTIDPAFAAAHWRAALGWRGMAPTSWNHGEGAYSKVQAPYRERLDAAVRASGGRVESLKYRSAAAGEDLDFLMAVRLMRQYVEQRPRDIDAWKSLVDLSAIVGDRRGTAQASARVDQLAREAGSSAPEAINGAVRSGDAALAIEIARRQLERHPNEAPLLYLAHRAFLSAGMTGQAAPLLARLARLDFPVQYRMISEIHQACAEGRRDDARRLYDQLSARPDAFAGDLWYALLVLGQAREANALLNAQAEPERTVLLRLALPAPAMDVEAFPDLKAQLAAHGVTRPRPSTIRHGCAA